MIIPVTPIRKELSRIVETKERIEISPRVFSIAPSVVTNIPGVTLLERRDSLSDCRKDINCVRYCFGKNIPRWVPSSNPLERLALPAGYFEVEEPIIGDLAIYIDGVVKENVFIGGYEHVGRISARGLIVSKWNRGDVYLHSPELVPWQYGEILRFFRKK